MAHKPLIINPRFIRPLPKAMWDVNCASCDKRQSRWQLFPSDAPEGVKGGILICSLCWLYDSQWGKTRREDLDQMIRDVEVEVVDEEECKPKQLPPPNPKGR